MVIRALLTIHGVRSTDNLLYSKQLEYKNKLLGWTLTFSPDGA